MLRWKSFSRVFLLLVLLISLLAGISAPMFVDEFVKAAPLNPVLAGGDVVISMFRSTGPNGGLDEFIELFNRTTESVPITGWKIKTSSGCGSTSTDLATITSVTLNPGQHYLLGNSGFTGTPDKTYSVDVANNGGVALFDASNIIVDSVGMCSTTLYKEFNSSPPFYLAPLSGIGDQSYERADNGCLDTNDNDNDFNWNQTSSNTQDSSSIPFPCIRVIDVSSTAADGIHTTTTNPIIAITVKFSTNVNVTGSPQLLLDTGVVHHNAIFDKTATDASLSQDTIFFNYTVIAGDVSADLDYVATDSLSLNGGTITGAVGDATLELPGPGTGILGAGSLGINNAIIIDNQIPPSVISFKRQVPLTTPTNADSLIFHVIFSEAVKNVDFTDFAVNGTTTADTIAVALVNSSEYNVTISGGDLGSFDGVVGLDLSPAQNILDSGNSPLPNAEPAIDETYTLDNTAPTVTVDLAVGQQSGTVGTPIEVTPIYFTVVFNEAIDVSTFIPSAIVETGFLTGNTWKITNSGDNKTFTLSAIAVVDPSNPGDTIIPTIGVGKVTDVAGNGNEVSTGTNSTVYFNNNTSPRVTVDQAFGQADPTSTLPIKFTVVFSKAIIASFFTPSDITQNGTATGITWSIADSGDHTTFTLSATAVTGRGTLIPSIAANRVTDLLSHNNTANTFTDNSISYTVATPTPLPTATSTFNPLVLINEVAWAGTSLQYAGDEWIELYNMNANDPISLNGWKLQVDNGTTIIDLASFDSSDTIPAGGFFLLARSTTTTNPCTGSDTDYQNVFQNVIEDKCFSVRLVDNFTSGQHLRLLDSSNNSIDEANFDRGNWPAGSASPSFASMERKGKISDSNSGAAWGTFAGTPFAINRNGLTTVRGTPKRVNWITTVLPTSTPPPAAPTKKPTPYRSPTPVVVIVGRPIINEFLARPGFDWNQDGKINVFDEFIEIKNAGAVAISLSGFRLDDEAGLGSEPFTLSNIILQPGERIVYYGLESNILLGDGGDTVRLIHPNGEVYDSYTYPVAKNKDQSICRMPDSNSNEFGFGEWKTDCIPTPNLANTREGKVPSAPVETFEPAVCNLPDTLPADFLFAECGGYGSNIWSTFYWDQPGWQGELYVPDNLSKWESFIK